MFSTSSEAGVAHEYADHQPLRQRMIEDMNARKLGSHTQRSQSTAANGSLHFSSVRLIRLRPRGEIAGFPAGLKSIASE